MNYQDIWQGLSESRVIKKKVNSKELIKDEIGDIIFVLTCLCNQMEINLENCIIDSIEKKNKKRFRKT